MGSSACCVQVSRRGLKLFSCSRLQQSYGSGEEDDPLQVKENKTKQNKNIKSFAKLGGWPISIGILQQKRQRDKINDQCVPGLPTNGHPDHKTKHMMNLFSCIGLGIEIKTHDEPF